MIIFIIEANKNEFLLTVTDSDKRTVQKTTRQREYRPELYNIEKYGTISEFSKFIHDKVFLDRPDYIIFECCSAGQILHEQFFKSIDRKVRIGSNGKVYYSAESLRNN